MLCPSVQPVPCLSFPSLVATPPWNDFLRSHHEVLLCWSSERLSAATSAELLGSGSFKTELRAVLPSFDWGNGLDQDESTPNTLPYSSMKI